MTTMDEIKLKSQSVFAGYPIRKVSVFGSYAKGMQTDNSDVDMVIHDSDLGILEIANLIQQLTDVLKVNIDLVSDDDLSDVFKFLIKDEEVVIYEKQR